MAFSIICLNDLSVYTYVESNGKNYNANNNIKDIYIDKSRNVWIGTANGLNLFESKNRKFTHYLKDLEGQCFAENKKGDLIIGTNKDHYVKPSLNNEFEKLLAKSNLNKHESISNVRALEIDHNEAL